MFWWIFEFSAQSECGDDFIESCWEDYASNIFFSCKLLPSNIFLSSFNIVLYTYKKYFEMNTPLWFEWLYYYNTPPNFRICAWWKKPYIYKNPKLLCMFLISCYFIFYREEKSSTKWKTEKATLGFRIYKIWQILNCFAWIFRRAESLKLGGVTIKK